MGVITKNREDYISFSIKVEVNKYINKKGIEKSKEIELRFIDSFKFMSSSLDSLVNNLACGNNEFFGFEDYNKSQYKLLIQKGIYPYEYMEDRNRFKETTLPPKEAFYSKLNMSVVSNQDYEHARRVWKEFGLKDLGEYHDLYLKTDVILLANIFEVFRKICLDNYGLDPAHFYTAPGLAWKACLKKARIRLELLLDPDMLLMSETEGLEEELSNPSIDGLRPTIPVWVQNMPLENKLGTYNIWMPTIHMVGQCLNHYLPEDSAGLTLNLTMWENSQITVRKDTY